MTNNVLIYSFTPYDCIADPNAHGLPSEDRDGKDNGDNHHKGTIDDRSPWYCGVDLVNPCQPNAPWVVTKDTVNRRLVLKWVALGTSTGGDIVSELKMHITPDGVSSAAFSTPKIDNPLFATTVTIDNLVPGHDYVFRLVAQTQNGPALGLPLELTF